MLEIMPIISEKLVHYVVKHKSDLALIAVKKVLL